MPENDRDCDRKSSRSRKEIDDRRPDSGRHEMTWMRSDSGNGKPRRKAALTMVKPTVLAPMPRAMAATPARVNQRS